VIWVVVHGLRIAIHALEDTEKEIEAENFVFRLIIRRIIQDEKPAVIASFISSVLPDLIHLVLDNIPALIEEENPCIRFASSELRKFEDIPSYITHLKKLRDVLERIYFVYKMQDIDFSMPPELIDLAKTFADHHQKQ
jgi:alanyl-tRNA synthetase